LVQELKRRLNNDLSGIFSLDLWNELYFSAKDLPFSKEVGFFIDETGIRYDLSDTVSRQALADSATIRWVNVVTSKVKDVAPTLLVTASVFCFLLPMEVGRSGYKAFARVGLRPEIGGNHSFSYF
jgi:hypothetical protein